VVFVREMEAELTDAALTMFDKMMGGVFCKADRQHKDNLVKRLQMAVNPCFAAMINSNLASQVATLPPFASLNVQLSKHSVPL
jgi:hypothetical protein